MLSDERLACQGAAGGEQRDRGTLPVSSPTSPAAGLTGAGFSCLLGLEMKKYERRAAPPLSPPLPDQTAPTPDRVDTASPYSDRQPELHGLRHGPLLDVLLVGKTACDDLRLVESIG